MTDKGRGGGNRGFGDALAATYTEGSATPAARLALPTDSVLASRSTTLNDLASGKLVTDRTIWVPANRCRPWPHHNRDLALLNETTCADLIGSFKSEGRQRFPAIVRRLKDDPTHDFEIIAGVRRNWTVAWLNAHNYPNFEFLVTVQPLTDEEAFRLADVENRARLDLTDLERARDYAKALDLFYGGRQNDMAARLNLSPGSLSRLLELARLPAVVIDCFAARSDLKVEHAKQLAPLLKNPPAARRLLKAAADIAASQRVAGATLLRATDVVRALLHAGAGKPARAKRGPPPLTMASASKRPMLRVSHRGKGVTVELLPGSGAARAEIEAAFAAILDDYLGAAPHG